MSEKELLYIEDMLGHLEYFKKHLDINSECVNDKDALNVLKKISKKACGMYANFYEVLKGGK